MVEETEGPLEEDEEEDYDADDLVGVGVVLGLLRFLLASSSLFDVVPMVQVCAWRRREGDGKTVPGCKTC